MRRAEADGRTCVEEGGGLPARDDVNESRSKTFLTVNPLQALKACGEVRQLRVTIIGIMLYHGYDLNPSGSAIKRTMDRIEG